MVFIPLLNKTLQTMNLFIQIYPSKIIHLIHLMRILVTEIILINLVCRYVKYIFHIILC